MKVSRDYAMKLPLFFLIAISYVPLVLLSLTRNSFFLENLENISPARRPLLYLSLILPVITYGYTLTRAGDSKRDIGWPIFYILIVFLALTPSFLSNDSAFYFIVVRNWLEFGANPQLIAPNQIVDNPWLTEIGPILWLQYPTLYGPLFSPLLAPIFALGLSLTASTLVYKSLMAIIFTLAILLFYQLSKERKDAKALLFSLAANPALLINFILEGHNDLFLILFLITTVYALKNLCWTVGALLYGISLAMKSLVIGVFPLFILRPTLWPIIFLPVVLGALLFDFSIPLIFDRINMLSNKGCFYSCTPTIALLKLLFGDQAGIFIGKLSAVSIIGYLSWRYSQKEPAKFIALTLTSILFLASLWISPWYLSVAIPFFLLSSDPNKNSNDLFSKSSFALTCYAVFYYFSA